jgi:hypothetical protein
MEQPKRHPMAELLLYTAHQLADQYHGREEANIFSELISAAEESETGEERRSEEHEQGKLPPTTVE